MISSDTFEELQLLGNNFSIHHIKAKILPDRNFIAHLTYDYKLNWVEMTEQEYEEKLAYCKKN